MDSVDVYRMICPMLTLPGLFAAGMLTFVTPCVLPLIPIYLSALIGTDIRKLNRASRGQLIWRALSFSVGFTLVFTLLGMTASSAGAILADNRVIFELAGGVLILLFGLKFAGIIHIPWMERVIRTNDSQLKTRFATVNAFVMGFVFAAGWSPCIGPILGSALTYAASATANPLMGGLYLSVYGAGFALPLLLTAVFVNPAIALLRRISPHLPKIEKVIGALLLVVSFSMFSSVAMVARSSSKAPLTAALPDVVTAAIKRGTPVMVEFFSKDCSICQRMEPVLASIGQRCSENSVQVEKIDLTRAENRWLINRYRISGVPTFVFFDQHGLEVARLVGEQSEQTLIQALSTLSGQPCPGVGKVPTEIESITAPAQGDTCLPSGPQDSQSGSSCGT